MPLSEWKGYKSVVDEGCRSKLVVFGLKGS